MEEKSKRKEKAEPKKKATPKRKRVEKVEKRWYHGITGLVKVAIMVFAATIAGMTVGHWLFMHEPWQYRLALVRPETPTPVVTAAPTEEPTKEPTATPVEIETPVPEEEVEVAEQLQLIEGCILDEDGSGCTLPGDEDNPWEGEIPPDVTCSGDFVVNEAELYDNADTTGEVGYSGSATATVVSKFGGHCIAGDARDEKAAESLVTGCIENVGCAKVRITNWETGESRWFPPEEGELAEVTPGAPTFVLKGALCSGDDCELPRDWSGYIPANITCVGDLVVNGVKYFDEGVAETGAIGYSAEGCFHVYAEWGADCSIGNVVEKRIEESLEKGCGFPEKGCDRVYVCNWETGECEWHPPQICEAPTPKPEPSVSATITPKPRLASDCIENAASCVPNDCELGDYYKGHICAVVTCLGDIKVEGIEFYDSLQETGLVVVINQRAWVEGEWGGDCTLGNIWKQRADEALDNGCGRDVEGCDRVFVCRWPEDRKLEDCEPYPS